jgi:hypothetical protein
MGSRPKYKPGTTKGDNRKVQRVEKRLERLEIDNQELQGQVKRAYQQLNIIKIRNDYLEHRLQQYLEQEQSAVLGEEDEDGEELWSSVGHGIE